MEISMYHAIVDNLQLVHGHHDAAGFGIDSLHASLSVWLPDQDLPIDDDSASTDLI